MDAMDLQLERLEFPLKQTGGTDDNTLNSLRTAKSTSRISSLAIKCLSKTALYLNNGLISLIHSLESLISLEVNCCYAKSGENLLVNMLQSQTRLEALVFKCLLISAEDNHLFSFDQMSTNIKGGRIKSIWIEDLEYNKNQDATKKINQMFDFILKSGPLLEEFVLSYYYPFATQVILSI